MRRPTPLGRKGWGGGDSRNFGAVSRPALQLHSLVCKVGMTVTVDVVSTDDMR